VIKVGNTNIDVNIIDLKYITINLDAQTMAPSIHLILHNNTKMNIQFIFVDNEGIEEDIINIRKLIHRNNKLKSL